MEITPNNRTFWKRIGTLFSAVLMLCMTARAEEDPWWDAAWTVRKSVTVDTTEAGAGVSDPIGAATVLIRLFDANWPYAAKEDLSDLRFVATDGKTVLKHHLEKIDTLLGEAFVWVNLPDIKAGAKTPFYMYYGSGDAKAAKADDPKGSFDADTVAVFHFGESGQQPVNSTKYEVAADTEGGKLEGAQIAGGIVFNGKLGIGITAPSALLWTAGNPVTITMWVKPITPDGVLLSRREGESSFTIGIEKGIPYVAIDGKKGAASQGMDINAWSHIGVVCDATKATLYVNGSSSGALAAGVPALSKAIILGAAASNGTDGFTGEMDELQIHKVARPAGFVPFAAASQGPDKGAKSVVVGDEEKPTDWLSWLKTGYMAVILGNLTHDGWVVIILCVIMSVVSWYIMFSKVRYLNSLAKGNEIFMKQWRTVAADLTVLDNDDPEKSRTLGGLVTGDLVKRLRKSSVYRIYHIGVEEIRHRLAADREQGVRRGLAGRSIQAIRAALDGGLVRETQRINKLIVILTICISGGPFLGLLGTVVGVMITFAAVAAAGEVNVNAIAPGIAAALLATVAGLAVAIPALFGYNYILSRVKDAKDDMHIFIDEFVTKMAEFYKEKGNE